MTVPWWGPLKAVIDVLIDQRAAHKSRTGSADACIFDVCQAVDRFERAYVALSSGRGAYPLEVLRNDHEALVRSIQDARRDGVLKECMDRGQRYNETNPHLAQFPQGEFDIDGALWLIDNSARAMMEEFGIKNVYSARPGVSPFPRADLLEGKRRLRYIWSKFQT